MTANQRAATSFIVRMQHDIRPLASAPVLTYIDPQGDIIRFATHASAQAAAATLVAQAKNRVPLRAWVEPEVPPRAPRSRERGPQKTPTKVAISIRVDADALERWRASGPGWQTRLAATIERSSRRL